MIFDLSEANVYRLPYRLLSTSSFEVCSAALIEAVEAFL